MEGDALRFTAVLGLVTMYMLRSSGVRAGGLRGAILYEGSQADGAMPCENEVQVLLRLW